MASYFVKEALDEPERFRVHGKFNVILRVTSAIAYQRYLYPNDNLNDIDALTGYLIEHDAWLEKID